MRDSSLCVDSALPVFVLHHLPVGSLWIFARFQHSASYFRHSVAESVYPCLSLTCLKGFCFTIGTMQDQAKTSSHHHIHIQRAQNSREFTLGNKHQQTVTVADTCVLSSSEVSAVKVAMKEYRSGLRKRNTLIQDDTGWKDWAHTYFIRSHHSSIG